MLALDENGDPMWTAAPQNPGTTRANVDMRPPGKQLHTSAGARLFPPLLDDYYILTDNGCAVKQYPFKGQDQNLAVLNLAP